MGNYNVTITDEGAALLASVIANQGTITFTEARLSSTNYVGQEQTLTKDTFSGTFLTTTVAASVVSVYPNQIRLQTKFSTDWIYAPYDMYSVGIIGTDGNTTALVCVLTTSNPDRVEPSDGMGNYYNFRTILTVSSTSDITVVGTTAAVLYDTDIVDNLTTADATKVLSANMGRVLKGNIDDNFSGQSNRNFLDNGWFTVNQRGATTVTSNGDYGADRWKKTGGTSITFSSSGVTLNGGQIAQDLEDQIPNGIYTASIKYSDGSIESGTVTKNNDTDILAFISRTGLTLGYVPSSHTFYMYSSGTVTVRALKLEGGSVSTLANDVEPDYTTELLKCQRKFYRMLVTTSENLFPMANRNGWTAYLAIDLPVPMDGTLTVTYSGTFGIFQGETLVPITNMSLSRAASAKLAGTVDCGGGLTAGYGSMLYGYAGAYIDVKSNN